MAFLAKHRIPVYIVAILTVILVVLAILTYILDHQKSNWVCGPFLFLMEMLAITLQAGLIILIWITASRRTKNILLTLSVLIFGFIVYGFVNFIIECS
jgi:cytochrome bd-type quinol oxidase subunit 2